jgi:hypothetical protein
MQNELHDLGIINRFNGLDILETRAYVKPSCELCIDKINTHHGWENEKAADRPVPMRNDAACQATLELATAPETEKEQRELEKAMGFSYRQAIGELIFALTICHPDIAVPVIKLSQHASCPAVEHYKAVKAVFVYLNATREDRLVHWRRNPRDDLPDVPDPRTVTQTTFYEPTQTATILPLHMELPTPHGEPIDPTDDPSGASYIYLQEARSTTNADTFQPSRSARLRQNLPAWLMLEKPRFV